MEKRRDFLKLFGVGSAVVATGSRIEGKELEVIKSEEPIESLESRTKKNIEIHNWMDVQVGRLYSAIDINPKEGRHLESSYDLFSYGVGSHARELGRQAMMIDTNMWNARMLCAPEVFLVKRMGILFSPLSDPELRSQIAESYTVELILGNKIYQRAPLCEMFSVSDLNERYSELPIRGSISLEPLPLIIESQQSFRCNLMGIPEYSCKGSAKLWVVLDGLHARGIQ